jgi:hypothetical protein
MGFIFILVGAIGLAVVFPPLWFVYLLFIGVALLDRR